jgi:uncharacterized membrane protein
MNWGWRFGGGGMGLWWLFGLLVAVALVVGVVWLLATLFRGPRHAPPHQPWQPPYGQPPIAPSAYGQGGQPAPRQTPHEILRERLARGEITVEEYQRTLEALGPESAPPSGPQGPQPPPSF